jgi:hypothetical protein
VRIDTNFTHWTTLQHDREMKQRQQQDEWQLSSFLSPPLLSPNTKTAGQPSKVKVTPEEMEGKILHKLRQHKKQERKLADVQAQEQQELKVSRYHAGGGARAQAGADTPLSACCPNRRRGASCRHPLNPKL